MRLGELSFVEVAALEPASCIVLLPIGATEAHGPHLPLLTDGYLSEALADRVARALAPQPALIAPTVHYAKTDYASEFSGTISVRQETSTCLVAEIVTSLQAQGFTRVCLVNNHLEPNHIASLQEACARVRAATGHAVGFPDQTEKRWARTLTEEFKRGDCHAGRYETALMLAARPALVDEAVRAALPEVPISLVAQMRSGKQRFVEMGADRAYFGDPASATAKEGEAIFALLVTMVTTVIAETWDE